jgi:UDP-glucose 4-epimerase
MNILVTGGAGYVGSICAEVLVLRGHSVVVLDNLYAGHRGAVPAGAAFVQSDLGDREGLQKVFTAHRFDAVMHFAAMSLVEKSVREPGTYYRENVANSILLLEAMHRHGVQNLIFSSTAAVYGEPEHVPIPEEHPKSPINPYGRTKLTFERILEDFRIITGLRYASLRYFNAAGASKEHGEDHRNETHVIPILLQVALGQRPQFQISGTDYSTPDGTCVRDYVHVVDIAEAHVLALDHLEKVSGEAFNVGNSRGYSVQEVLEAARRVTGKDISAVKAPRRAGDPATLVASSEKIRRVLGWAPRQSDLETILQTAWEWKKRFPQGYSA